MRNPFPNLQLGRIFSRRNITISGISVAGAVLIAVGVTAYYYIVTSADTIIVTTTDFPAGFSPNLTPDSLTDHVMAHLQDMIKVAGSNVINDMARQEGLGPRSVKQTFIPIRAFSHSPSPLFDLQWRGVSLNRCRRMGMGMKAKAFLELGVVGLPDKGWRLTALLKEGQNVQPYGSAPRLGGPCADFEKCADDLAEQILGSMDVQRLLNYDIKVNTHDSNEQILELYKTISAASLDAEDLIAWGNAYSGLRRFDEALQKYQEALTKDPNSCPVNLARGFVYFSRPHGTQMFADLEYAEKYFRAGVSCNTQSEFALNSLCHTLLREWVNYPKPKPPPKQLLVEAKENCEKALAINPEFVVSAVNIGFILYRQNKRAEALHQLETLSQKYSADANLSLNYGFLLYLEYLSTHNRDLLKKAITETVKSSQLDPNRRAVMNNLGYFYYEDGNYTQALDSWKKANLLASDNPDCIAGLALGFFQTNDKVSAIALLTRAIEIDGDYRIPSAVREKRYWGDRALSDLVKLLRLLPMNQTPNSDKAGPPGPSGRTL